MNQGNSIITGIILFVGMILAIILGNLVVTDQKAALMWVGITLAVVVCIGLGKNIWLLIPFSIYLKLDFPWLPGRFPPGHIAVLLAGVWFLMLFAMRKVTVRFRMTGIEIAALLVIACIVQVYLRNPVGLQVLGSSSFGARPYFDVAVAVLAFIILSTVVVDAARIRTAMTCMLLGGAISIGVKTLAMAWSPFAMFAARFLGAFGSSNQMAETTGQLGTPTGGAGRNFAAQELAIVGSRWLASKINPLRALISPKWCIVLLVVLGATAYSGFRNIVAVTALNLILAGFYWGRVHSVAVMSVLAGLALIFVALVNQIAPLPPNVQRAFSFLPGTWERRYVDDAEDSTKWRVEMWKEALFTDRYIDNKVLGDGLGFKASEFRGIQMLEGLNAGGGGAGFDLHREAAMLAGDYHSGPVSFIRTIGYIGLIVSLGAMMVLVVQAHRLIMRARGTEWFGIACFFCIPVIWWPVVFIFVGGAFNSDMALFFLHAGFLRLLQNNLPLPALGTSPVVQSRLAPIGAGRKEATA